jgi:hypothetical protein
MVNIVVKPQNVAYLSPALVASGGGSGREVEGFEIVGNDLFVEYNDGLPPEDLGRVVGFNGADGTLFRVGTINPSNSLGANGDLFLNTTSFDLFLKVSGAYVLQGNIKGGNGNEGNGITAITQPSSLVMRVFTRDLAPVDITLLQGATGAEGPSSLLPFINKPSFIDHLMPIGTNGGVFTTNFQGLVRSGSGTVAFRNNQTIGGSGQITLSKGVNGSSDLVIRRSSGLSGARIGTTAIDYVFCFYADNLPTSADNSVLRLCAQNDATASIIPANRTGFYVDFGWSVDGVKATFSCFNNTVSTVIVDTLSLATGTLYAVRVRVSSSTAQLYINGVLRQTINTNLPVFAPIQMSVGLARTGGGVVVSYTVDALASEAIETQNNYVL